MKHSLDTLNFSNSFAELPDSFYSLVSPTPFDTNAQLIHFNTAAGKLIDLDYDNQHAQFIADIFSGKSALKKSKPLAMLYAGHQFGHYVPQLGDGRAIMLGETTSSKGDRWEIQLKGSGLTPYSRNGDGRAVLRSSIREYLCSEAMFGLGIPTTRALCLVGSKDEVYREQVETATVLTRLAQSHVRFGSFEIFFYRNQHDEIRILADYIIKHHYPDLTTENNPYLALLETVTQRTASLIAQWQAVGFSHGVMNSDNMSILGLTLDYGPFGFMEDYNPGYICNHSDHTGRYAFNKQPEIGLFNLSCLAQALLPLMEVEAAKAVLATYQSQFLSHYHLLMANKLGFSETSDEIQVLQNRLLEIMQNNQGDYTNTFRALCHVSKETSSNEKSFLSLFKSSDEITVWLERYKKLLSEKTQPDKERQDFMLGINPKYILRNYMAQIAIDKATNDDFSEIDILIKILHNPFAEHDEQNHYTGPAPAWVDNLQVSCSS